MPWQSSLHVGACPLPRNGLRKCTWPHLGPPHHQKGPGGQAKRAGVMLDVALRAFVSEHDLR